MTHPSNAETTSPDKIKLSLSGYYQQWGVVTDQHLRSRTAPGANAQQQSTTLVDNKHNSEVCVIGQTTLDNGLTIGVNIQLEAFTEADTVDESFLFLQSPTVGQAIIGDKDNAAYLLHVTAPDGGISIDSGDTVKSRFFETGPGVLFDSPLATTNLRLNDNDSGKFTYITPRFAGFQVGVSFIPEFESGGDDNSALTQAGSGDSGRAAGQKNGVAGGVNYRDVIGGVGVQASGGFLRAESFSGGANTNNANLLAYNAGAQLSYGGFAVGGGWMYVPQGQRTATTRFNGSSWSAGASYEFGPYKVGADYFSGNNNRTPNGGKDRLDQAALSGTYVLGPGIRLVGGLFYYNWQAENKLSENENGIGAATGLKLSF
ncbi:MAG: porin [Rhodospirillales bacterium]|nr:porin [Rhodospirillales bacterium]